MWFRLFVFYFVFQFVVCSRFVGDKCNDGQGVCELFSKCDEAKRQFFDNHRHNLARCGFSTREEIVCCPSTGFRKGNNDPRPADRECQKIKDAIPPALNNFIIGGVEAQLGDFPHMVALGFEIGNSGQYKFDCGGSLISNRYVLTAAHCVITRDQVEPSIARMGVVRLCPGREQQCGFAAESDVRIDLTIAHPNYTKAMRYDDIALLRLSNPVKFKSELAPVCLYTEDKEPGPRLTATGYGLYNTTIADKSNVLLQANLTYEPQAECRRKQKVSLRMPQGLLDTQLCAGDKSKDTCQGDSGGPLVGMVQTDSYYRLVGVTSTGGSCADGNSGIYTAVSKYLDWIESIVWPDSRL